MTTQGGEVIGGRCPEVKDGGEEGDRVTWGQRGKSDPDGHYCM